MPFPLAQTTDLSSVTAASPRDGLLRARFLHPNRTILIFNFLVNVAEVELAVIPNVNPRVFDALDTLDITLTVFYCLELSINLFVHQWDFFYNGWSVFDAVCVILSVAGNLLSANGSAGGGLTVIRSIRIFKIVRIFSRSS